MLFRVLTGPWIPAASYYTVQQIFGSLVTYLDYVIGAVQIAGIFVLIRGLADFWVQVTSSHDRMSQFKYLMDMACGLFMFQLPAILTVLGFTY